MGAGEGFLIGLVIGGVILSVLETVGEQLNEKERPRFTASIQKPAWWKQCNSYGKAV